MKTDLYRAWLLHSRPYKEHSVIAEFYVQYYGRLSAIVHGVRRKKMQRSSNIQPFQRLLINWKGRTELKRIHTIELEQSFQLKGSSLFCGFYINELMLRSTIAGECCDKLFNLYEYVISAMLNPINIEPILRFFELELLSLTGHLMDLEKESFSNTLIKSDSYYQLIPEVGLVKVADNFFDVKMKSFIGKSLLFMKKRDFSNRVFWPVFKRFTRLALIPLVGEKPIKSRCFFVKK